MQRRRYDPWIDPNENKKHYRHGITLNPFEAEACYDAIILAVAHRQFKALQRTDYERISTPEPVLIDVKVS